MLSTGVIFSFIALSVLLGVFINKEKLQEHQFFGIALVFVSILILSSITK